MIRAWRWLVRLFHTIILLIKDTRPVRAVRRVWPWLVRLFRTAVLLIKDKRIPKWVRVVMALGCFVPIPGPFDEMFACLCLGIVWLFWRPVLREVWQATAP